MASLVVRDLDPEIKALLRVRAAEHGRSMEAEVREILAAAVTARRPATRLGSHIHGLFTAGGGEELELPDRSDSARAAEFER